MLFSVPELFAREYCPGIQPTVSSTFKSISLSADSMNCVATKKQYYCQKVEDDLDKDQKYKVIQCDAKSLEANRLGNVSIADCVWNGLIISGESLTDLSKLPGAIAGTIAKGFKETQICNASVDKKREILNAFNLTIEDPRYKLEEYRLGNWLNDASCSEIEKLVSARYQSYQANIYKERIWAINAGKKPAPLKEEKKSGPGLAEMLKSAMVDVKSTYECYTPKVKAEMICAGVTSLLADVALGGGVAMAAKKIAAVVKSTKALNNVRAAASSGQAVDLADAARLLNGDRVKAAAAVLNRMGPMTEIEKKAVIIAHEVGKKEGRGFYSYTKDDIAKKVKILREAGFDPKETRALMEAGITGEFRKDAWAKSALMNYMDKILKVSTTAVQQEGLLAIHDLGLSSGKGFAEKAKEILKKANFNDSQISAILKAKADNEGGLLTVANVAAAEKKAAEVAASKVEEAKKVAEAAARRPAAPAVVKIEDSAGRKAVLNNFKDDDYLKIQHTEIPENLTGEALETKLRSRKANALEIIKKIEKKERREFDPQAVIIENGAAVSKSRKAVAEAEEQMEKLPKTGADLRRKDLQDKIDRSSTSLEIYQKKCKAALELYREAHGYAQYMRQYERDYDNYCK